MPRMSTQTLLALAQNAADVGQLGAACEFFDIALQQAPNDGDVLEAYAELLVHGLRDAPRAVQMLRHAIAVHPREGHVKYLNLAQLLQGREALRCYQQAREVLGAELARARKRATQSGLRRTLAGMHCAEAELWLTDLCDEPEAERACEAAVDEAERACGNSVEVHQLRGSLRLSQRRPVEALAALRAAVALTHRLGEAHQPTYDSKIELGKLLMQAAAPGEAVRFLLELLQLDDGNAYVWFLLGEASRLRRRFDDAARLLRRARVMLTGGRGGGGGGGGGDEGEGASEALREVDAAIGVLVAEMGGPDAAARVPHMDAANPIDFLDDADDDDDGEGGDDEEGEEEDEPEAFPAEDEDEDEDDERKGGGGADASDNNNDES